jgi:O-antigen/teichoic acid export membrane protein|tara:strand:- start:267 stop:1388 length:1122 start_codon:yes stop_codon:yes gene_type:complete
LNIKGLLSIGFTDIVGTAITAIFWFFLATLIEPKEFGEISYVIGIAAMAGYISLIGTQDTIVVYVAKKIKIQSTLNVLSLAVGGISLIVIVTIFDRIDVGFLLLAFVVNTLAIGDLLGRNLYKNYSKYFLIQKILTLVLGFSFYYLFGVEGIIFALALSYSVYTIRVYKGLKDSKISFAILKPRYGFIINNYTMVLANASKNQVDKIIIAPLLGFGLLGNYALSLQIVGMMLMLTTVFFKYLLPQDAVGNSNIQIKKIAVICSVGIAISGIILSPIIIPELFPKYTEAVDAIQIMSLLVIPSTISMIYTSKFLGLEKSKLVLIPKVVSLISIIICMIFLGSMFGIIGLAIAYVLSVCIEAIIFILINMKLHQR